MIMSSSLSSRNGMNRILPKTNTLQAQFASHLLSAKGMPKLAATAKEAQKCACEKPRRQNVPTMKTLNQHLPLLQGEETECAPL